MAEAIARSLLAGRDTHVASAGVYAGPGSPASPEAVEIVGDMGLDLSGHRSSPVTADAIAAADAIFGMTDGHVAALLDAFPEAATKVKRLDVHGDVSDPIGGGPDDYRAAAEQIEAALRARLRELEML